MKAFTLSLIIMLFVHADIDNNKIIQAVANTIGERTRPNLSKIGKHFGLQGCSALERCLVNWAKKRLVLGLGLPSHSHDIGG